jgi:hypothetical protein
MHGIHASRDARPYRTVIDYLNSTVDVRIAVKGLAPCATDVSCNVKTLIVIPHRGSLSLLEQCLNSLSSVNAEVAINFDEEITRSHSLLMERFPLYLFFSSVDPPRGPYAFREYASMHLSQEYIVFMDSDDLCVDGRVDRLLSYLIANQLDIVGSSEIRLDQVNQTIVEVQYPSDVNAALRRRVAFPQLFPTCAMSRDAFKTSMGFDTCLSYAADTQFLLRSSLLLNVGNVDEPLYLRRVLSGRLTTSPLTMLESPRRKQLLAQWKSDFALSSYSGRIQGSLIPGKCSHEFKKL